MCLFSFHCVWRWDGYKWHWDKLWELLRVDLSPHFEREYNYLTFYHINYYTLLIVRSSSIIHDCRTGNPWFHIHTCVFWLSESWLPMLIEYPTAWRKCASPRFSSCVAKDVSLALSQLFFSVWKNCFRKCYFAVHLHGHA